MLHILDHHSHVVVLVRGLTCSLIMHPTWLLYPRGLVLYPRRLLSHSREIQGRGDNTYWSYILYYLLTDLGKFMVFPDPNF